MTDLTILCVTKDEPHARPFLTTMRLVAEDIGCQLVFAVDGPTNMNGRCDRFIRVHSQGYIESVLDQAVGACDTRYILRLDDDERLNDEAVHWLKLDGYTAHDHWAFRRANLYPDAGFRIDNPPLWPDLQTRLSIKEKSGDRPKVHVGSPHGTGTVAPGLIEHHKFLVRKQADRQALMDRYETIEPGAGTGWAMFSMPELYEKDLKCVPL